MFVALGTGAKKMPLGIVGQIFENKICKIILTIPINFMQNCIIWIWHLACETGCC